MAESDFQREPLSYAVTALRRFFRHQSQTYVSGNMLLYYEKGNPKAAVAPDVFDEAEQARQEAEKLHR